MVTFVFAIGNRPQRFFRKSILSRLSSLLVFVYAGGPGRCRAPVSRSEFLSQFSSWFTLELMYDADPVCHQKRLSQ
jgi:hypothetical protein